MDWISICATIAIISLSLWSTLYFDKRRIRVNAENHGYKDVKITWTPFTSRSIFSLILGKDRHFLVTYIGKDSNYHFRYCTSSFATGVYWRDKEKS